MRIDVYAITKNEEKFVARFMDFAKEADNVYVLDTGSTDATVDLLRNHGALVQEAAFDPWRFDVARNASLALVPADCQIAVCVDLDEVFTPGWRNEIELAWESDTTRLRYPYTWKVNADGTDHLTFWYEKIHDRHKFRWVHPVHEIPQLLVGEEKYTYCDKLHLRHFPDETKSRSSYLGLLELSVREDPDDDRNAHYLGREYFFYGLYEQAIEQLMRHLRLPRAVYLQERAASMRYISKCYTALGEPERAVKWAHLACAECPNERETWYELGKLYYVAGDWVGLDFCMRRVLSLPERRGDHYMQDPETWGARPWDYLALAAYQLGRYRDAFNFGSEALHRSPTDERLIKNLQYYAEGLQSKDD